MLVAVRGGEGAAVGGTVWRAVLVVYGLGWLYEAVRSFDD
jgi:hypothetical protein